MKVFAILAVFSLSAFAVTGNLIYTNGPAKGKDVTKALAYVGYQDFCFTGTISSTKASIYSLLARDSEKTAVFATIDTKKDIVVYGYVSTKCLEEGESAAECRLVRAAKRCILF